MTPAAQPPSAQATRPPRSTDTVQIAVVDTETSGLSHRRHEVVRLVIQPLTVHRQTGAVVARAPMHRGLRQPTRPLSVQAQRVTSLRNEDLQGASFDSAAIAAALDGCELVIAHHAAFDRPFLEAQLPVFQELRWACSRSEIDWEGTHGQAQTALWQLLPLCGHRSDGTVEGDCEALVKLLQAPLPGSPDNGFLTLLKAAERVTYRLHFPDPGPQHRDFLLEQGYVLDQITWHAPARDSERDAHFEALMLDLGVFDSKMPYYCVEHIDARCRHSARRGPVHTIEADPPGV